MNDLQTLQLLKSIAYELIQKQEVPNSPSPDYNSEYQQGLWAMVEEINGLIAEAEIVLEQAHAEYMKETMN